MFSNFFYLVIALIIYLSYQLPDPPKTSPAAVSLYSISLFVLFVFYCWIRFRILARKIQSMSSHHMDQKFSAILTQSSIIALSLFTLNIYIFNLPYFFSDMHIFLKFPTLLAIFFVLSFIGYLSIVWIFAHHTYRKVYRIEVSGISYVLSNISFAIPVLFAWTLISGSIDIINILPFEWPKMILNHDWGQVIYSFLLIIPLTLIAPDIIQRFWRCSPLEEGVQRTQIENLLRRSGLRFRNILFWPIFSGRMITAGVMGLFHRFRYILVTKALFQILQPEEVDAVIAHEIGHVKKKHLLYYLFFVTGFIIISISSMSIALALSHYFGIDLAFILLETLFKDSSIGTALRVIIPILLFLAYFRILFGYFMRNFERQADCYIYALFDNAKTLISTFRKIILATGQPYDKPNWHHFSIKERIEYLELCEMDRSYVLMQDRKIFRSLILYFISLVLFIGAGVYSHSYYSEKQFEAIIEMIRDKKSTNYLDYVYAGDLLYENGNYRLAIDSYEYAITMKPDNSYALNNLAWLYATCEDQFLKNKEKALEISEKAYVLDPKSPDILDTFAESLFQNGKILKAIEIQKEALSHLGNQKKREHFEKQLKRFEKKLSSP